MNASLIAPVKKVVIIGPECTGKSELAQFLADHYQTSWVPEYARGYLDNLVRPYNENDLLLIAHGQLRIEDEFARQARELLICDTNLYVVKIWSEFKYGTCHEEILERVQSRAYDLYLLTNIDVPWKDDPQREHPDKREQLFKIYQEQLAAQPVPVIEIQGEREQRRKTAIAAIDKLLTTA